MALTPLQRVRYKTTLDETLLPDAVITELIEANTDPSTGAWNFEETLADAFDYMAAKLTSAGGGAGVVKSYAVGATSVTFASTFSDAALYWRSRSGTAGASITKGIITRADYAPSNTTEFGKEDVGVGVGVEGVGPLFP